MKSLTNPSSSHSRAQDKHQPLIEWHVELLSKLIKQIVAQRTKTNKMVTGIDATVKPPTHYSNPRNEAVDVITMPKFDAKKAKKILAPEEVTLSPAVMSQLRDYVSTLSALYRNNPFHSFEV